MCPRFGLDGRGKEKISYTQGGSNLKNSFLSESMSRKLEYFYPVGYTHMHTKLGVVSGH